MSRPYDLKIFGDLTADPEILKKVRFLHGVDLLISPNDWAWQQMAFAQAARGAAFIHTFHGQAPFTTRIPRVLTLFEEDMRVGKPAITSRLVSRSQGLIVLSDSLQQHLTGNVQIPSERVVVAPPAAAISLGDRRTFPQEPYILYVMNSTRSVTQLAVVLEMIQDVQPRTLHLKVLVTDRRQETAASRIVRHYSPRDRVEALAPQDADAVADLYQRASAILIVGRGDGQVMTAFNGLAAGTPIVAVDDAYLRESLSDAATFWLAAGSPRSAAESLSRLLTDAAQQSTLVAAGQEIVRAQSWKHTAAIIHQKYLALLQAAHRI